MTCIWWMTNTGKREIKILQLSKNIKESIKKTKKIIFEFWCTKDSKGWNNYVHTYFHSGFNIQSSLKQKKCTKYKTYCFRKRYSIVSSKKINNQMIKDRYLMHVFLIWMHENFQNQYRNCLEKQNDQERPLIRNLFFHHDQILLHLKQIHQN